MPATNMTALMRDQRRKLQDYMYQGDSGAADPENAAESTSEPASDTDTGMTVLNPGDPDPGDQYVYEQGPGGAWMVYPPGTPCDTDKARVALDHPATTEEFDKMTQALAGSSSATGASAETDTTPAAGEGY